MTNRQNRLTRVSIRSKTLKISRSLLRAIPSTIVIAFATFACFTFHVNFAVVSFIFLIIVVLQSLTGDFVSSVIVSVVAFLCLNYFFPPQNGESGVAVRLLRDEHKVIGAIGFDGLQDVELTAEPFAALAGLTRFATGKVQADRKPGREAYGVSYPDLLPLSRTFFDVFAIETALIVSPFNLPVTVTLSLRNDRILSGSPVTEYDQPKISKTY
jgi:hypothetical protein